MSRNVQEVMAVVQRLEAIDKAARAHDFDMALTSIAAIAAMMPPEEEFVLELDGAEPVRTTAAVVRDAAYSLFSSALVRKFLGGVE